MGIFSGRTSMDQHVRAIKERLAHLEAAMKSSFVNLSCQRLSPDAVLPAKAGELEAGWDICCVADDTFAEVDSACIKCGVELKRGDRARVLTCGATHLFHTGFACAIDPGYAVLLWDRSGMGAKKQIHRLAGVIDCTYRGEWLVALTNLSRRIHVIKAGDKIIQGIITKVIPSQAGWVDTLPESSRGTAGFGSTGR